MENKHSSLFYFVRRKKNKIGHRTFRFSSLITLLISEVSRQELLGVSQRASPLTIFVKSVPTVFFFHSFFFLSFGTANLLVYHQLFIQVFMSILKHRRGGTHRGTTPY